MGKPDIKIEFEEPAQEIRPQGPFRRGSNSTLISTRTYSTLDSVKGIVTITTYTPTPYDEIEILLTGVTRVAVDRVNNVGTAMASRCLGTHRFLKLHQPVDQSLSLLPADSVLEARKTYRFPFTFIIPTHLLPRSCSHKTNTPSQALREAHQLLPPSFGDSKGDWAFGNNEDMAPEQVNISYAIEARITRGPEEDPKLVCQAISRIRIRPAYEEAPPVDVDNNDSYCLRQEKAWKKNLLSKPTGRLSVEADQPGSFRLPAIGEDQVASTYIRARLRFDPETGKSEPPTPYFFNKKLRVTTFYAVTPQGEFPKKDKQRQDSNRDWQSDTIPMSCLNIQAVEWQKHEPCGTRQSSPEAICSNPSRSSSFCSEDGMVACPSSGYKSELPFYTASVLIPISLPTSPNSVLPPTFHTCIVSRTYTMILSLNMDGQSKLSPKPLELKVPVQISTVGGSEAAERQRLAELHEEAWNDVNAAFEPRLPAQPWQHQQFSQELPPVYAELARGTRRPV